MTKLITGLGGMVRDMDVSVDKFESISIPATSKCVSPGSKRQIESGLQMVMFYGLETIFAPHAKNKNHDKKVIL